MRIVLASGSPRRRELLAQLGVTFEVRPADLDESVIPGETPAAYVERLARAKATAVAGPGELVIAADTTVDVDDEILGKPADAAEAAAMLTRLAGRAHQVHTGVAVAAHGAVRSGVVVTTVRFAPLSPATVAWYVATGEPLDKAGAYALQGIGGALVEAVDGSVSNVIGLPLVETVRLVRAMGVALVPG